MSLVRCCTPIRNTLHTRNIENIMCHLWAGSSIKKFLIITGDSQIHNLLNLSIIVTCLMRTNAIHNFEYVSKVCVSKGTIAEITTLGKIVFYSVGEVYLAQLQSP